MSKDVGTRMKGCLKQTRLILYTLDETFNTKLIYAKVIINHFLFPKINIFENFVFLYNQ